MDANTSHGFAFSLIVFLNYLAQAVFAAPVPTAEVAQAEQVILGVLLAWLMKWLSAPAVPVVETPPEAKKVTA